MKLLYPVNLNTLLLLLITRDLFKGQYRRAERHAEQPVRAATLKT